MNHEEEMEKIKRNHYEDALKLKDKYFKSNSGLCYIEDVEIDKENNIFFIIEYEEENSRFKEENRRVSYSDFHLANKFKEVDDLHIELDDEQYQKIRSFISPALKNKCSCCKKFCREGNLELHKEINYLKGIGAVVVVGCNLCGKLDFFSVKTLRSIDDTLGKFYC